MSTTSGRTRKGDVIDLYVVGKGVDGRMKLLANDLRDALVVVEVKVNREARSQGVGTRLYEAALREACALNQGLASDTVRSIFAEAFWRKQARKGRAKCLERGRALVHRDPEWDLRSYLRDSCLRAKDPRRCVEAKFKAMTSGLPKPKTRQEADRWPCYRWWIPPTKCGTSLDGLRGKK